MMTLCTTQTKSKVTGNNAVEDSKYKREVIVPGLDAGEHSVSEGMRQLYLWPGLCH